MPSPFSNIFAIDPLDLTKVAALAEVVIFAPGDEAMEPLNLTDVTGVPLGNPITTNEFGFGPAFIADLDQVAWSGGGLSGLMESYAGVKTVAVAAQDSSALSAASAEGSRLAAELSAERSAAAATEQVELELAENRAVMDQASLDVATSRDAAVAAARLVDAPAGNAVLAAIAPGGAAHGELSAAIDDRARIFNVLDYGSIGLGLSDETAAVQAACDAIKAAGRGKLYFPPGRYAMDGYVTIPSNIEIYGDGAEILKLSGATSQTVFAGFSNGSVGYGSGANNIIAHDLKFRGSFEGAIPRGVCAFSLNHTDGFKSWDLHFVEASGNGHQFDLQGCRNIRINTPIAEGFRTEFGGLYSEFVQIDCSFRIGGSLKDAPGSYDGLPTCDVILDGGKFLPLTIGTKTYPAPIPMGAHAVGEGVYYRDISFTNNYIEHLVQDTISNTPGITHWMSVDGLTITGNTFNNTTGAACFAINIQRGGFAYPLSEVENGSAASIALTNPQPCKNITLDKNKYIGFTNVSTAAPIISIYGSANALFEGLSIGDEQFKDCTPNYTTTDGSSCIRLVYGRKMKLGIKSAVNIKRLFHMSNCSGFTIASGAVEKCSSAVAIKLDSCSGFTVGGVSFEKCRGVIDISACTRFTISAGDMGEDSSITNGPALIRIVGASSVFSVTANAIFGTATTSSAISIGGASTAGTVQANVGKWAGATKIYIAPDSPTVTQANNNII